MRQKPEALQLADLLFGIDVGGLKNAWLNKAAAELRRLHAENAELIQELRNIASADWRKWDEEMRTPDEFVYWAKSRARFAIAKAEGGCGMSTNIDKLRKPADSFAEPSRGAPDHLDGVLFEVATLLREAAAEIDQLRSDSPEERAMTTPHYDDSGSVSSQPEPSWYCMSIDGAATLCIDQADAVETALDADLAFPRGTGGFGSTGT